MGTFRTIGELHSLFLMAVTESEYPLIIHLYLMYDMLSDKCIDDTVECRWIHLFGIDEVSFQFTECERSPLFEESLDMTAMYSREHIFF